jgi:hypothetical protein
LNENWKDNINSNNNTTMERLDWTKRLKLQHMAEGTKNKSNIQKTNKKVKEIKK